MGTWSFGWLQCWTDTNVTLAFEDAQVIQVGRTDDTDGTQSSTSFRILL